MPLRVSRHPFFEVIGTYHETDETRRRWQAIAQERPRREVLRFRNSHRAERRITVLQGGVASLVAPPLAEPVTGPPPSPGL